MSDCELTTLCGYAVFIDGGMPIAITDTFLSAIEAAEMHALALSRRVQKDVENVSILTEGTEAQDEGFFARWEKFDEEEEEASLYVFRRYRKPDGYVMAGAWREKPLFRSKIKVTTVPIDFFNGLYVPFEEDETTSVEEEGGAASDDEEDNGEDDDRTYIDGEE